MTTNLITRTKLIVPLFIIAFLFQACAVNLPAVRDYSKATVLASNSYEEIVNDLPKSCVRRVEVSYEGEKVILDNGQAFINHEYKEKLKVYSDIEESLNGIYDANSILKQYAEAIGKLASDDVVTFATELKQLESNLIKIQIKEQTPFDNSQAKAVFQLAEFLIRAATDGYRQKELQQTINMAEPYMPILVGGLISINKDYILILEDEELALEDKTDKLNRRLKKAKDNETKKEINEKLFNTLKSINAINDKQKAAAEFSNVLKDIISTHSKLAGSSKKELQSTLLLGIIREYVEELIPIMNNLRKALNS